VGFDVELASQLAQTLGVRAEFVPVRWPEMPQLLADGVIDVMPGVWYRPFWFATVKLSDPYLVGTMGLAVRDERRDEFASIDALRRARGLKIGVPLDRRQIELSMRRYFGDSDVAWEAIEVWKPYFEGRHPDVDGFLMPAENASGWTLLHPEFTVVVPQPNPVKIPYAFGMAPDAGELAVLVDEWVRYADSAGEIRRAYEYWVLGEGAEPKQPRWSIMRNVLGWGED
jgi:ABC-type amino acid transport substrate-binding protein